MGYSTKSLLTDKDSKPIPQEYDQVNDVFIPLRKMEYYGKSTDVKPSPSITPIGATFMEMDTKDVYMNDGTSWELF
jgi:hypothetical protein